MWLRANAHNIIKPFDARTWRTCRPWLSLKQCKLEYRQYKKVSLGYIQVGNVRLSDKQVRKAIAYEAKAQGRGTYEAIMDDIETLFDISEDTISCSTIFTAVNKLRRYRGEPMLNTRDCAWTEIKETLGKDMHYKPKITYKELADMILKYFQPGEHNPKLWTELQPLLLKLDQHIDKHSHIFKRAIEITGTKLQRRNTIDVIRKQIFKYYKYNEHRQEPLERIKFIVKGVDHDDPSWALVDTHLSPRDNWTPKYHDPCIDNKYADIPVVNHKQRPFYEYHTRHHLWRKKQNLPWNILLKGHSRGKTTEKTIHILNQRMQDMGYVPYHIDHEIFNVVKVQGLVLT
tara:strand:- start:510 stop:1541 length:1032 start_codon:yes stop_codon:yes gene_type:complete